MGRVARQNFLYTCNCYCLSHPGTSSPRTSSSRRWRKRKRKW